MFNAVRLEPHSINYHRSSQRYLASIVNGQALQQALSCAGGIDWAWSAMDKPSGMIEMSMRENNCSGCNGAQSAKPICPAIYHNPGVVVLNQQCAMSSVPARAYFDLAACAEEGEFKHGVFCCHCLPKSPIPAHYRNLPAHPGILQPAATMFENATTARTYIVIWQSLALRQIKTSPSPLY